MDQAKPKVLIVDGNASVSPKLIEAMQTMMATVSTSDLGLTTSKGTVKTTLKEVTAADEDRIRQAAERRARRAAKRIARK